MKKVIDKARTRKDTTKDGQKLSHHNVNKSYKTPIYNKKPSPQICKIRCGEGPY